MLKHLLDEHISPRVGKALRRQYRRLTVNFMAEWEKGRFLGQDDSACLEHAEKQGLTLVTYDRRTIPPLLKDWADAGWRHGGVIFVDEKTISPSHIGGQVRALSKIVREAGDWDWTNRTCFPSASISAAKFRHYDEQT